MKRMRCPAAPMCNVTLRPQRTPGGGEGVEAIYPHHARCGADGEVPCPGGGTRIMVGGGVHKGDALRIQAAGAEWVKEAVTQLRRGESKLDDETAQLLRELLQVDGVPLPTTRKTDPPPDSYFPGRPADAPEPGVGERPAGRPAMDLGGGFLGRAAVDNARDQLVQLLSLAIGQMGQAQDTLAKMTAMVDSIVAHANAVEENLRSAAGLCAAAIGTGSGAPEPAQRLRAQIMAATESVTVSSDGLSMALRVRIEQAYSQIATGIQAAEEYRALP